MHLITKITALAAGLAILAGATACDPQPTGDLSRLQSLARSCPSGSTRTAYVADDVSTSSNTPDAATARAAAVKDIATRVAVCGGNLRVDAFTSGAAASRIVYDGTLDPAGATEIAKLRKVTGLVESVMGEVETGLAAAARQLPDGSDITSQFALAKEYAAQKAVSHKIQLSVDLLTDGVQTTGVVLNTPALTNASAVSLAKTAPVTVLPATTTVRISGLGKTGGGAAPTTYVDALKTFYSTYCTRTGAASCEAVTDYTAGA
ncbi:hypothetical protein KIH31_15285 [Paenarthrobacter sp. DKR-5]|uniref:hypothetical protein n=1 Tax=Paenarthrobacter sp. DKR-5 TaxID=2835535 RepID=UPI001BDC0621|nr:hypothetical protein [Paenarthrobacter sp. DKR-5]MBT1003953.1 hypothetical protein [Paenarthrobacter sp. DKR-5]